MHMLSTHVKRAGMALVAMAILMGTAVQAQKIDPNNKYAAQEKAAFQNVVKNLDPYGNFFLYINTEEAIKSLDAGVEKIKKVLKPMLGAGLGAQKAMFAEMGMKVGTKLYEDSGVRDIQGLGITSLRMDNKFYRNKTYVAYGKNPKGKVWEIFGKKSHEFGFLDKLPKETALAVFTDFDPSVIWKWQFDLVQSTQNPQIIAIYQAQLMQLKQQIDLEKLIGSMGGEFGMLLTLDNNSKVTIPLDGQALQIPEPGLALFIKVKDQTLQSFLQSKLVMRGQPIPFQENAFNGIQMRNYLIPIPAPFLVSPTFAKVGDYFVMASSPKIMKSIITSKGGRGLTGTAEFKMYSKNVPMRGNMFHYVSPSLGKAIVDVQKATLNNQPQETKALMTELLADAEKDVGFSVGTIQLQEMGMLGYGNSNVSGGKAVIIQAALVPVAVAAIGAGLMLPTVGKAREKARRVNCAGNLKQIGLGLLMYSGDHNGRFPDHLGKLQEEQILNVGKVYVCPSANGPTPTTAADLQAGRLGYLYFGKGLKDDDVQATTTVIACDKPGNHSNGWMNFLFIDGHVTGMKASSVEEACRKRGWICTRVKRKQLR